MSVNPNASPSDDPAKCTTCNGKKKDENVQVAAASKNETFEMHGGGSVNVFTANTGHMTVTTFDGGGNELDTYHLDAAGNQK